MTVRSWVIVMAVASLCVLPALWPADAPFISDEPRLILSALQLNDARQIADVGLEGRSVGLLVVVGEAQQGARERGLVAIDDGKHRRAERRARRAVEAPRFRPRRVRPRATPRSSGRAGTPSPTGRRPPPKV